MEMALEFDIDVLRPKIPIRWAIVRGPSGPPWAQGCGKRAFVAAGQPDQAFGMFFEVLCCDRAFPFLARSFILVIRRHRFWYPVREETRRGRRNSPQGLCESVVNLRLR